jgi:biopolymer transport protein ExbB/TolQ
MSSLHTALAAVEIALMGFLGLMLILVTVLFVRKLKALRTWTNAQNREALGPALTQFAHTHKALIPEALEKRLSIELSGQRRQIEQSVAWIGTIGANAPFVGLAGTVLGILAAFQAMATQTEAGSAALMASISRSLIATAAGLFVAIPAVIFYNVLRQKIRRALEEGQEVIALLVAERLQHSAEAWQQAEAERFAWQKQTLERSSEREF